MEYNGTKFSFLNEASKKFVKMTQKANQILGAINKQDEFTFDFTDAVKRFKEGSFELDNFCSDESLSHHLINNKTIEDTKENRELYYLSLRSHIKNLQATEKLDFIPKMGQNS